MLKSILKIKVLNLRNQKKLNPKLLFSKTAQSKWNSLWPSQKPFHLDVPVAKSMFTAKLVAITLLLLWKVSDAELLNQYKKPTDKASFLRLSN